MTSISQRGPGSNADAPQARFTPLVGALSQREVAWPALLAFLILHVPLAWAMKQVPLVATVHAFATMAAGVAFALQGRRPQRAMYVVAYIAGAELLWRGSSAGVFWEVAKYSIIVILGLLLVRANAFRRADKRALLLPLLLVPSLFALPYFDRGDVSFNLSGPVSMAVSLMFFSVVQLTREQLVRLFLFMLGPIVGLAGLSAFSTIAADPSQFIPGGKSTTAGIGPNQVSSILGLGILLCILLAFLLDKHARPLQRAFVILATLLGVQCLLTFSRGGIWGSMGALVVVGWYLLRDRRARAALVGTMLLAAPILWVVLPRVDAFTNGVAMARVRQTDLTGRDKIMQADLMAFREHPILGVGPGQSTYYHSRTFRQTSAHTEYTRLPAEHGVFGLAALGLILSWAFRRWRRRDPPLETAVALGLTAWTLLYLGHSAMRLAAPGFIFGLAGAAFLLTPRFASPGSRTSGPGLHGRHERPPQPSVVRS